MLVLTSFLISNWSSFAAKKMHLCVSECDIGIQKKGLLGCGDGAEANVLTKVYEEKKVLGSVLFACVQFCL